MKNQAETTAGAESALIYTKPQVQPYGRIEPSLTGSLPLPPAPP